jgi:phosphatidylglycerophosphate synthase
MIKARYDTEKISVRIGLIFSGFGLSPNSWTLLSLVPAVFGFLSIVSGDLFSSLILFALAGAIDAVDGAVARVTGSVTALGGFLDGIIDRYVEMLMYLGILIYLLPLKEMVILPNALWVALLIFGAIMPTYVTAYSHHRGVITEAEDHRRMEGLIARNERMIILYLGMLLGTMDQTYLIYFVAVLAVLANFTALQRIWFVVSRKRGRTRPYI